MDSIGYGIRVTFLTPTPTPTPTQLMSGGVELERVMSNPIPIDFAPRPLQRAMTQADQNKEDEKARQKAQAQLVQSWMDRLQLISVITTFFAANEVQLLSTTTPQDDPEHSTTVLQTSNAMLCSALILHSFSAVIAFIGAFVLVTYKLKEEKDEQAAQEASDVEKHSHLQTRHRDPSSSIWTSNPRLEQVGSVRQQAPPVELLKAAHSIAIATAFVGFVFVVVGILCFVWAQQSRAVSVFSSATLAVCLLVSAVIINPLRKVEERMQRRVESMR